MSHNPRANRYYNTIDLPTLTIEIEPSQKPEIQFMFSREVCSGWRMLTDVRFKWLGRIPIISRIELS